MHPNFWHKINLFSRGVPTPIRLAGGLFFLAVIGTFMLSLPISASDQPLKLNEAFFTAISALTVTGLTIIAPGADLSIFGQIVLATLIQIGGVGYMVAAVIVFQLLGRQISLADRLALRDSFGLLDLNAIVRLTGRVIVAVLLIEATGALLLWLHWREMLGDKAVLYAIFHAISAFCNAGFDLFSGVPGFAGVPNDNITLLIFGVMIFLGGLGIPVVADLLLYYKSHRFSLHTRLTIAVSVFLVVAGWLAILWAETKPGATLDGQPIDRIASVSLFQSVSSRTAGFWGFENYADLSSATQLTISMLMFVGTAPASMGGGITTGTFTVMLLAVWAYARGRETPHILGRSIGTQAVRRASAVLTISIVVVLGATWLLLESHPELELGETLFEVISAFATCGLSFDYTGRFTTIGHVVLALVMFWGRLGALTIVMALAQLAPPRLLAYPEEQILI